MRSMWRPQLKLSVCCGVLCTVMGGVVYRSGGGAVEWSEYHCLRVLCIFWAVRGVRELRGS